MTHSNYQGDRVSSARRGPAGLAPGVLLTNQGNGKHEAVRWEDTATRCATLPAAGVGTLPGHLRGWGAKRSSTRAEEKQGSQELTCSHRIKMGGSWGGPSGSVVKNPPAMLGTQETWVRSLGREDPLEEGMATHSSALAWRIPWTEEPGGLRPVESQRVGHG